MAADDQFSIDIHYNKLLDWLIDRRHCESKWHGQLHEVRKRLDEALKQLSDVKQLTWISEQPFLNYFDCVRVFEAVKEVDGDSKSLFGQYTSPRVKEWSEILKLYEKKNVYMAECAQQLTRNVNYEIPALKQQISRCQQTQRDSLRKEGELTSTAASLREKYENSCKDMGIKGEHVKEELAELVDELPGVYKQVLSDLPSLISPITYYKGFVKHTTKRKIDEEKFLPVLMYVLTHGNVTVYEWKHDEPPPNQNQNQNETEIKLGNGNENGDFEIDWGNLNPSCDDQQELATAAGIETGIDFGESEIDFGTDIDLSSIVIEDSGEIVDELAVVTKTTAQPSDPDLQTLLGSTHTRNLFLDDVMELKEFLAQRIHELSTESSSMLAYGQLGGSDSSEELSMQSVESISEMLGHVTKILTHLTNQRTHHLFLIKGSQRYLERLSESLQQQLRLAHRALSQVADHAARREEATAVAVSIEPKLTSLVKCVKNLQKQVAADISKRYSNRVVNIIGESNQI